jgi:hypothetical protein
VIGIKEQALKLTKQEIVLLILEYSPSKLTSASSSLTSLNLKDVRFVNESLDSACAFHSSVKDRTKTLALSKISTQHSNILAKALANLPDLNHLQIRLDLFLAAKFLSLVRSNPQVERLAKRLHHFSLTIEVLSDRWAMDNEELLVQFEIIDASVPVWTGLEAIEFPEFGESLWDHLESCQSLRKVSLPHHLPNSFLELHFRNTSTNVFANLLFLEISLHGPYTKIAFILQCCTKIRILRLKYDYISDLSVRQIGE